jgi:hypothetical protein
VLRFERRVAPVVVLDRDGEPMLQPFLGGFEVPRPQLVDIDGDGLLDILTGKRFWAHGPAGDPQPNAKAVLYWFQLKRGANKSVDFIPHLIDDQSGTGVEVKAVDYNRDGKPDILVGNKRGVFVFTHVTRPVSRAEWEAAQPKPLAP